MLYSDFIKCAVIHTHTKRPILLLDKQNRQGKRGKTGTDESFAEILINHFSDLGLLFNAHTIGWSSNRVSSWHKFYAVLHIPARR